MPSKKGQAPGQSRPLPAWPGLLLVVIGLIPIFGERYLPRLPDAGIALCYQLYAILLIGAAAFLAVWLVEAARGRPKSSPRAPGGVKRPRRLAWLKWRRFWQLHDRVRAGLASIDWRGGWLAVPLSLALTALSGYALYQAWRTPDNTPTPQYDEIVAGLLVVAAFPVLVLERHFTGAVEKSRPEAPALARLCRVALAALLSLALAAGVRWLGLNWGSRIEEAADILLGLIAAELFLRNAAYLFLPLPPLEQRRGHADSFVAGLVRLRRPSLDAIGETVRQQFGLDLARSWALTFVRRAFFPVLMGMILFCWLLTGVTALPLDQRAVYQAFGRPVAVFHAGLHIHLPWPFGLLKPVEYGVVRQTPVVFAAEDGTIDRSESEEAMSEEDIEGTPPWSANRLWNAEHPSEASYLVANLSNGRQSFEIVNIDLRVVYRIGLSDEAARQAVYNIAAPDAMIRSAAGRMLARHFARLTIDDLLGQNRETFVQGFQRELQARLTEMSSGVDVMAVVVEAIHPPAAAASSYQDVQAAAIRSVARISLAKASASHTVKQAEQDATLARNEATAAAAEQVEAARADLILFDSDRKAHQAGGQSFLFERRLDRLDKSLSGMPLVIVDHRIAPSEAPTLDLRGSPTSAFSDIGLTND